MINIIITATSPPITPTYGPLDEDSVFAEKKRKNLKHVPVKEMQVTCLLL
jgi:hypothetical protein